MTKKKRRYDEDDATMWVYRELGEGDLVPRDEVKSWTKQMKQGETEEGDPLDRVNYVFDDEATAEANSQALSFAKIGTFTGSLDDPEPYEDEDSPEFDTKEDFGIE